MVSHYLDGDDIYKNMQINKIPAAAKNKKNDFYSNFLCGFQVLCPKVLSDLGVEKYNNKEFK